MCTSQENKYLQVDWTEKRFYVDFNYYHLVREGPCRKISQINVFAARLDKERYGKIERRQIFSKKTQWIDLPYLVSLQITLISVISYFFSHVISSFSLLAHLICHTNTHRVVRTWLHIVVTSPDLSNKQITNKLHLYFQSKIIIIMKVSQSHTVQII